jgi:hypothetical protein
MVRGFETKDEVMNRNSLIGTLLAVVLPLSALAQAPSTTGGTEKPAASASSSASSTAKPSKTVKSTPVKQQQKKVSQPRTAKPSTRPSSAGGASHGQQMAK